jgi:hypothetical protein
LWDVPTVIPLRFAAPADATPTRNTHAPHAPHHTAPSLSRRNPYRQTRRKAFRRLCYLTHQRSAPPPCITDGHVTSPAPKSHRHARAAARTTIQRLNCSVYFPSRWHKMYQKMVQSVPLTAPKLRPAAHIEAANRTSDKGAHAHHRRHETRDAYDKKLPGNLPRSFTGDIAPEFPCCSSEIRGAAGRTTMAQLGPRPFPSAYNSGCATGFRAPVTRRRPPINGFRRSPAILNFFPSPECPLPRNRVILCHG